jgi:hypothetical protein
MVKPRCYLIIDPQHEYARELIAIGLKKYGLKPVCIHIDSRAELYKRPFFPELRTDLVLDNYYLDKLPPPQMAAAIRAKYDVVGIMPYFEQSLAPAAQLVEALGLAWNKPDVVRRFRDKSGLKDFLRNNHPEIPLGASRRVHSVDEVFGEALPPSYVIKPNDGFANRDIGFFTQADSRDAVAKYFGFGNREAFILEETLVGVEYAVNGQMDAAGRAQVVSVLEYERVPANGKPNVYHRTFHVPQTDPNYASIAAYAEQVMNASGLIRAPFHLELMLTAAGPRLIEVGARFGGTRYVFATNAVHGGRFSHFELAAHHYLFDTPYEGAPCDWDFYNRVSYVHLDGIAERTERVYTVDGIKDVESLPQFDGWVVKPEAGGLVRRTVDLYTVPYSCHLKSFQGRQDVIDASERVKALVRINAHVGTLKRLQVDVVARLRQVQMRGQWLARRLFAA